MRRLATLKSKSSARNSPAVVGSVHTGRRTRVRMFCHINVTSPYSRCRNDVCHMPLFRHSKTLHHCRSPTKDRAQPYQRCSTRSNLSVAYRQFSAHTLEKEPIQTPTYLIASVCQTMTKAHPQSLGLCTIQTSL